MINSLIALLLDVRLLQLSEGHHASDSDALIENLGMRQITVVWRIRAIFGGKGTHVWGNMERKGVANLDGALRQT